MRITPEPGQVKFEGSSCRVWSMARFAEAWYQDADCAAHLEGPDARRREILFAVCCAESYLFEWVRDAVLQGDFDKLAHYFPRDAKRGLRQKWKDIPEELLKDQLIAGTPYVGDSHGQDWDKLVRFRDGLVHASASRPAEHRRPPGNEPKPTPTMRDLNGLSGGWAIGVVVEQVKRLNNAAGTSIPDWAAAQPTSSPTSSNPP